MIPGKGPTHTALELIICVLATNNPPLVTLEPEDTTLPLNVINNPAETVDEDKDNVGLLNASAITLNCNLLVPSSKTK
jgi:hypothetical protein